MSESPQRNIESHVDINIDSPIYVTVIVTPSATKRVLGWLRTIFKRKNK